MKRVFFLLVLALMCHMRANARNSHHFLDDFFDLSSSPNNSTDDKRDTKIENRHFLGAGLGMSTQNNMVLSAEYGYGIFYNLRLLGKASIMFPRLNSSAVLLDGELQYLIPVQRNWNVYPLFSMGVYFWNGILYKQRIFKSYLYFAGGLGADYQIDTHWILTMNMRFGSAMKKEFFYKVGMMYKF